VCIAVAGAALSLLAANVVRADSFSDQAAKLDILGVHLGMTPAQAKSVLAQHRKGMRWMEGQDEALWSNERVFVQFSPPPGDPKVEAVQRIVAFDKSQSPTVDGLASSLGVKFGQPTWKLQSFNFQEFVWAWDKAGQIANAGQPNICDVDKDYNDIRMGSNSRLYIPVLQQQNDGGCAMAGFPSFRWSQQIPSGRAMSRLAAY